jgi:hypothetical protein
LDTFSLILFLQCGRGGGGVYQNNTNWMLITTNTYLLLPQNKGVELLLKGLVAVVDAQLSNQIYLNVSGVINEPNNI